MNARSLRDATKALQTSFTGSKIPLSLPSDARRMLQAFIDEQDACLDPESASRVNQELKQFWERFVDGNNQKLGAFAGVLKELRPAILEEDHVLEWYHLVVRPLLTTSGVRKLALEDAQAFLTSVIVYDGDEDSGRMRARTSSRICNDLLGIYVSTTSALAHDHHFVAPDNAHIAKQVETVLVSFGKKMPKHFFLCVDDLLVKATTRLQGLTLLSSFLQHQTAHLYLVIHTPLVDDLLKCLMNDTSTTVLSAALASLIMLLPHMPAWLSGSQLPRLFLVYSRILCWEKFSALSTDAQRSLVTDDRISAGEADQGDIGIDSKWDTCRPKDALVEPGAPDLTTYFTYLYGLFPLNFTTYIRRPRKYLKNLDFAGADEFDLDQAVIRSRSDQFQQAHLLHPNFYNMTADEELRDPKWPKMDPADVVAECHNLAISGRTTPVSPGPPPTGRLPELPVPPPIPSSNHGSLSPAISHTSLRSGISWRDTQSTAVDAESPVLHSVTSEERFDDLSRPRTGASQAFPKPSPLLDDFPLPAGGFAGVQTPKDKQEPMSNIEYLQQRLVTLQNEIHFERWHKTQYSQHIGLLMRKNVKDATVEAETLNLINANRTLKQQLEQVRSAREATMKDANLTRKQSNNLEANLTERFNKTKKEQETWSADAEELARLRSEMKNYRDLLSSAEARELNKSHELEVIKRDLNQVQKLQTQVQEAQRKVREYEFREFDYEQAKRELEIVQNEKETLQMRLQRTDQDRERTKRAYADRIAELEVQLGSAEQSDRPSNFVGTTDVAMASALADAQSKLQHLKSSHSRLLERFTDLELEYQSVKNQLTAYQGFGNAVGRRNSLMGSPGDRSSQLMSGGLGRRGGILESVYGVESEYDDIDGSEQTTAVSTSEPTPRRQDRVAMMSPVSPPRSETTIDSRAGLSYRPAPPSSSNSQKTHRTKDSGNAIFGYNTTAPLRPDERSISSGETKKEKIRANSEVRVYGRGGAQNIKMKPKESSKSEKSEKSQKSGGFKALKGIAGLQ